MRHHTLRQLQLPSSFDTSALPLPIIAAGPRPSSGDVLTRSFGWLLIGIYACNQLDVAEISPDLDRFGVRPILTDEERALLADSVDAATETRLSFRIYAGITGLWTLGLIDRLEVYEFADVIAEPFLSGGSLAKQLQQVQERPATELLAELDLIRVRLALGNDHDMSIGPRAMGAMADALVWVLGVDGW
jgi:hypothetical protein